MIDRFEGEFEFLSNFSDSPIEIALEKFPTVEHAFQAFKAERKEDFIQIQHASTPGMAKRLGRRVQIRPDWENIKLNVMEACLRRKFMIPELRDKLLMTEDKILIEGNWWHDNFWGDCKCEKCQTILGRNNLGKLLMKIRTELRK